MHVFVGCIIQIIIAFSLLWYIIGAASLFGLAAFIIFNVGICIPGFRSAKFIEIYREACGKRLSAISEMLQSMRIIKLFAWEQQFCARVDEAREKELSASWDNFYNYSIYAGGSAVSSVLTTVATLGAYTMLFKHILTSTIAFTSIAVLESLRIAVTQISNGIYYYFQYRVIIQRITSFLSQPVLPSDALNNFTNNNHPERIGFVNAEFHWNLADNNDSSSSSSNDSSASYFSLTGLNVEFIVGELNIIAGPTGCGKSSLLLALLGAFLPTTKRHTNTLGVSCSDIGYVAQQPWLQNLTIRENILFGQPYDEQRYHQVLYACALERDLEILDAGDRTQIGEKGITLSGGQKQRLALARAVYGPYQHLLLDDCLSAVDSHTARHIVQNCLSGPLTAGRTRILVTHHVDLCASIAQYAVLMNNGQIVATGMPSVALASLLMTSESDSDRDEVNGSSNAKPKHDAQNDTLFSSDEESAAIRTDGVLVEDESYNSGAINVNVYKTYIKAAGYQFWILTIAAYLILQLLIIGQAYWLVIWTRNSAPETNGKYVRTYLWIALVILLFAMVPPVTLLSTAVHGSRKMFRNMLHSVAYASIRFIDKTPVGRLINRFSNDMSDVDQNLPFGFQQLFALVSQMVFQLLIVCFALPKFIIASILVFVAYFMLVSYYVKANRNFKRLEAVNKSPLLSLCADTTSGIATIRAFGMQKLFFDENLYYINVMQRPVYLQAGASQWITCRVQAISVLFTLLATSTFIWNRDYISANIAGFALSYALGFLNAAANSIIFYTRADVAMNSVERICEYMAVEQEPPAIIEHNRPPSNWPEHGRIDVQNISIRYAIDQSPVIRDLSFSVNPGERIGIVGRTGAGKSTLSVAFFRFVEAYAGQILIDDVDISNIGLKDLRSRLTIIPQDPVLFSGTIRSNLDPFTMHDDAALWNSLRRTHLIDEDINAEKPVGLEHLDAPVAENGSNFSHGQRQLLSMARALLRNSRVIIMDEATASVDFETDAKIQQTIRQEFTNSTLLCIAHRLRTIIDYDRVMVLDTGRLVEFDKPSVLINRPDSLFRNLCERSGELDILLTMSQSNTSVSII
ncbi:P-loop containing nucleoside triphosphate hydrolase protein [Syncephalis fuscata]|nr:P-loop containing nucleoside triphosphate hydrolase protein [Syncephalis fuscata]